jgi:phosphate transport system permease protein
MIPSAKSGLVAALMLGLGRIIGETMIVLMVSGNTLEFPKSLLSPIRPLTATIAIEVKEVVTGSVHWSGLFALAIVLFILTFVCNTIADLIIQKQNIREI